MPVEINPVIQLLQGILDNSNIQICFRGTTRALDDPELSVNAGVMYVRGQLRELQKQAKAAGHGE